jgi:ubiquitin fusion degradation protein 1
MKILRMTGKILPLLIYPLENCSLVSISHHMSHRLLPKANQCQRYTFIPCLHLPPSHGSLTQPPDAFLGAGNFLNGRAASSSTQSTGKGKSKATDGGDNKVEETGWGTGQGRSLGSRPTNGVDRRTFGSGLVGVGGASVPRLSQRSGKKPRRRERSPTPDFGIDDDDDVIVIDSDVD